MDTLYCLNSSLSTCFVCNKLSLAALFTHPRSEQYLLSCFLGQVLSSGAVYKAKVGPYLTSLCDLLDVVGR